MLSAYLTASSFATTATSTPRKEDDKTLEKIASWVIKNPEDLRKVYRVKEAVRGAKFRVGRNECTVIADLYKDSLLFDVFEGEQLKESFYVDPNKKRIRYQNHSEEMADGSYLFAEERRKEEILKTYYMLLRDIERAIEQKEKDEEQKMERQ